MVDELLSTLPKVDNVVFYRANHGDFCSPEDLQETIRLMQTDLESPQLILVQIHLGLNTTPPEGHGLFVRNRSVMQMHRAPRDGSTEMTNYHPGSLSLAVGHYRQNKTNQKQYKRNNSLSNTFRIYRGIRGHLQVTHSGILSHIVRQVTSSGARRTSAAYLGVRCWGVTGTQR